MKILLTNCQFNFIAWRYCSRFIVYTGWFKVRVIPFKGYITLRSIVAGFMIVFAINSIFINNDFFVLPNSPDSAPKERMPNFQPSISVDSLLISWYIQSREVAGLRFLLLYRVKCVLFPGRFPVDWDFWVIFYKFLKSTWPSEAVDELLLTHF